MGEGEMSNEEAKSWVGEKIFLDSEEKQEKSSENHFPRKREKGIFARFA
jgi:polyhydroxyalkanoate synthesis regulator phasin